VISLELFMRLRKNIEKLIGKKIRLIEYIKLAKLFLTKAAQDRAKEVVSRSRK